MDSILIRLSDVSASPFGAEDNGTQNAVLRQIRLTIARGEWITVIGRNGSGKSTLAKLLSGAKFALVEGEAYRHGDLHRQGLSVPVVMQQPEASMIGVTPWEDIVLMLEQNGVRGEVIPEAAAAALRQVGLYARRHQPVQSLSGGQKQLTAIAGCTAVSAPLLILDEPTAMLDPEASELVMEQVRSLNRAGAAVVWITQRLAELREGDRVVAIDRSEVRFDGKAERFFEREGDGQGACVQEGTSMCELLGFDPPYAVETAWELERLGFPVRPLPIRPESLAKVVMRYA
ncbi:ABC transporter ATP-binding protein [Paenibacillus thailandensis]|uniref:ABC transporter ATP-binding protein n=1 Tax=Paenibacillus thailandensis TaxID=393250 RepID=A0ABW5QWM7_9BACL